MERLQSYQISLLLAVSKISHSPPSLASRITSLHLSQMPSLQNSYPSPPPHPPNYSSIHSCPLGERVPLHCPHFDIVSFTSSFSSIDILFLLPFLELFFAFVFTCPPIFLNVIEIFFYLLKGLKIGDFFTFLLYGSWVKLERKHKCRKKLYSWDYYCGSDFLAKINFFRNFLLSTVIFYLEDNGDCILLDSFCLIHYAVTYCIAGKVWPKSNFWHLGIL